MTKFSALLKRYSYEYPKTLVATTPAHPRDSARLLIYDRKTQVITNDTFRNLANYVAEGSVVVFNQTKVLPARLTVAKSTGGTVELLYVSATTKGLRVLANKRLELGSTVTLNAKYQFTVTADLGKEYEVAPLFKTPKVLKVLEQFGVMPLPPYLRHSPLSESKRRQEYQTIFSKVPGAVAAPTASLHFTNRLIKSLEKKGVHIAFVTLHVGLGTFAPLTEEAVKNKRLHNEYYEIDTKTVQLLNRAKKEGRPIIAVGTTVVRTLESSSNTLGRLVNRKGFTDLFITEDTKLAFVNSVITNFHVPESSLLMLVAAFIGRKKLMELYLYAVGNKYRLFSFGDGMFIK